MNTPTLNFPMQRRTFVSSLALAGAAVAAGTRTFAAEPAKRPTVGVIGCGWFGTYVLEIMAQNVAIDCIALCDPNRRALKNALDVVARTQTGVPRTFEDYRTMLATGAPDIVIIGTPDHWHALPAIAAMKAGADLMLEKPISVDVLEGEVIVATARKYDRVVQVNTQRRSTRCLIEARDKYIRSGRLGAIGLVETYSYLHGRSAEVVPESQPPAHLNYELWSGPAPLLPYRDTRWRGFMEYGNGQIGDLGVHMLDCVRWMLDLGWPHSISSSGGIYVDKRATANISDTQRSLFRYDNLDVSWEHRTWGVAPMAQRHWTDLWGARVIGARGTLAFTTLGYAFTPADGGHGEKVHMLAEAGDPENLKLEKFEEAFDTVQKDHILDFMRARETRSRPVADVGEGHISTACCILANIAQELGRPITYDPASRTVRGDAEATRRLARTYRNPWIHPDPAAV